MDYKKWYQSRTIRVAILQAIAGIGAAFLATYPALQTVGTIAFLKAVLVDIPLRYTTEKPIL